MGRCSIGLNPDHNISDPWGLFKLRFCLMREWLTFITITEVHESQVQGWDEQLPLLNVKSCLAHAEENKGLLFRKSLQSTKFSS